MNSLDTSLAQAETWSLRQTEMTAVDTPNSSLSTASTHEPDDQLEQTRSEFQHLQHVHTVGSLPGSRFVSRAASSVLPAFGGGKS